MSSFTTTQGIILSSKLLPGNDVIYTVLTSVLGKIRVYGRGVKNIRSKRKPHVQTGNLVSLVLRTHRETFYLQETTLISAFSQIKQSSEKISWLYPFLFMIDRLVPEHEQDQKTYQLMQKFLIELSETNDPSAVFISFANRLVQQLGYSDSEQSLSELSQLFFETTSQKLPINTI